MFTRRNLLLITLLMMISMLQNQNAGAQEPQKFRVVIADNIDKAVGKSATGEFIDITGPATEALFREFTNSTKSKRGPRFEVIGKQEVSATAERLGIKTLTAEGYLRIAEELKADLLVKSESVALLTPQKREALAGIAINIQDVSLRELVGLGIATVTAKKMQQAVERAAKSAARQAWERLRITAKVQQVVKDVVLLDRGIKGGVYSGGTFLIIRESGEGKIKQGKIGVIRAFAIDAEAEILEGSGFRPGDSAIRIYNVEDLLGRSYCPPTRINISGNMD